MFRSLFDSVRRSAASILAGIIAGCGIAVQDNGDGTVTISADLPDMIGASAPGEAQNGLIVTPSGVIEPGQCRQLEVSVGSSGGIEIDSNGRLVLKTQIKTRQAKWDKVPDGAGTTATSERPFFYAEQAVTISLTKATLVVGSSHVGNDTNNFVIVIRKRDGAGAATTLLTYTNNVASGGVTAWVPKDLGALATTLAGGESLTVEITKNGTGATLSSPLVTITYTLPG